jgi:hypothetical protein
VSIRAWFAEIETRAIVLVTRNAVRTTICAIDAEFASQQGESELRNRCAVRPSGEKKPLSPGEILFYELA